MQSYSAALNPMQRKTLQNIGTHTLTYKQAQRDMSNTMTQRILSHLINLGFVRMHSEYVSASGVFIRNYSCTDAGLVQIADIERVDREKANIAPSRNFAFMRESYTPPKDGFVRNAGNKHIPSRGI